MNWLNQFSDSNNYYIFVVYLNSMENRGTVLSVNISEKKGVIKTPVNSIQINKNGILNDAHAGDWNRQISLLATESILKFETVLERKITYGEFAENITTEGLILYSMKPLDILKIGKDIILEVTQIGKECHGTGCAIFNAVGKCVMPKEGIFCRVIIPGIILPGDYIIYTPKVIKAKVITLSDRAYNGIYEDKSGPEIQRKLKKFFDSEGLKYEITNTIIPDNASLLKETVVEALNNKTDIIITTGGTGIGKKDITIETLQSMIEKELPGIMEFIRTKYGSENPGALLSRGIAGTIQDTQIYTLPGSVKAAVEYMNEIEKNMIHIIHMIHGIDKH